MMDDALRYGTARWYIIEHPTRGTLQEQDYDPFDAGRSLNVFGDWRTRFSWSGPRTDAWVFYNRHEVDRALEKIHPRLRAECKVLRYGTWEEVGHDGDA